MAAFLEVIALDATDARGAKTPSTEVEGVL